jgi:WD40 repeat protein
MGGTDGLTMLWLTGHNERVRGLAYSPDGTALASCGSDWSVRLWDVMTGAQRLLLRGHRRNVLGVVFSPDGRVIASACREPTLRFWDATTGAPRSVIKWDAAGERNEGRGWLRAMLGVRSPSRAPKGALRAAVAAGWRLSRTRARRLDREEAARWRFARLTLSLDSDPPRTNRGGTLGSSFRPAYDPLRQRAERGEIFEITLGAQTLSTFVPVSTHGTFRGTFVPGLGFSLGVGSDLEVAFAPDGRTLAMTAGKYVHLWDLDRRRLTIVEGHEADVWSLAFAPDGQTLATGGHDGTVRLWDVHDGGERACFDGEVGIIDSVAFSPDGMTVAAGGKSGIVVWDVDERF